MDDREQQRVTHCLSVIRHVPRDHWERSGDLPLPRNQPAGVTKVSFERCVDRPGCCASVTALAGAGAGIGPAPDANEPTGRLRQTRRSSREVGYATSDVEQLVIDTHAECASRLPRTGARANTAPASEAEWITSSPGPRHEAPFHRGRGLRLAPPIGSAGPAQNPAWKIIRFLSGFLTVRALCSNPHDRSLTCGSQPGGCRQHGGATCRVHRSPRRTHVSQDHRRFRSQVP